MWPRSGIAGGILISGAKQIVPLVGNFKKIGLPGTLPVTHLVKSTNRLSVEICEVHSCAFPKQAVELSGCSKVDAGCPKGKVWMLLHSLASLELLRVGMKRMEVHCKGHIPGRNKLFSSVTNRIKSSSS